MPAETAAPASATPRAWAIALLLAAALTFILTYPTIPQIGSAGRLDTGDGRFSIWNVAWVAHAIVDDPRHLFDANIFYPHRGTLTYSELNLVGGALGVPAYFVTRNPLAAHNSAVVLSLLTTFMATWALVRRLTGSDAAGLVAATGYTFSAFTSSHTAEIQLLMLFGFPLIMIAFHRLASSPTIGRAAWLGAALALTALACGYYGVYGGGLAGAAALWWAQPRRRYWVALAVAAGATVAFVWPVLGYYLHERAAQGAVRATTPDELRVYSASWRSLLASSTDVGMIWTSAIARTGPLKEVLFAGVCVLALAAVAVASLGRLPADRRTILGYVCIAVVATWGALGPDGALYWVLAKVLPGMSFLRAPARLAVVGIFALSVVAGFGVRDLTRGRRWVTPALLALMVAELWVAWPIRPMLPLERPYRTLATLPRGGVVEFPFQYDSAVFHTHTRAMFRSTWNWQPLVNGYSDFVPADFYELALPITGFPDPKSFEIMRAHDVKYVVIRFGEYGDYRQALLDRFPPYAQYLRLVDEDQDVRLYEITSWPLPSSAGSPE
jgi:hypothetical protein